MAKASQESEETRAVFHRTDGESEFKLFVTIEDTITGTLAFIGRFLRTNWHLLTRPSRVIRDPAPGPMKAVYSRPFTFFAIASFLISRIFVWIAVAVEDLLTHLFSDQWSPPEYLTLEYQLEHMTIRDMLCATLPCMLFVMLFSIVLARLTGLRDAVRKRKLIHVVCYATGLQFYLLLLIMAAVVAVSSLDLVAWPALVVAGLVFLALALHVVVGPCIVYRASAGALYPTWCQGRRKVTVWLAACLFSILLLLGSFVSVVLPNYAFAKASMVSERISGSIIGRSLVNDRELRLTVLLKNNTEDTVVLAKGGSAEFEAADGGGPVGRGRLSDFVWSPSESPVLILPGSAEKWMNVTTKFEDESPFVGGKPSGLTCTFELDLARGGSEIVRLGQVADPDMLAAILGAVFGPRPDAGGAKGGQAATRAGKQKDFEYEATNTLGQPVKGALRAASQEEATKKLRGQGLSPTKVRERPRVKRRRTPASQGGGTKEQREFTYEAMNSVGQPVKGVIRAASPEEAIAKLRSEGLFPTKVEEQAQEKKQGAPTARRVTARELHAVLRALSELINMGMPILRSIEIIEEMQEDGVMRSALHQMANDIRTGATLSNAMEKHPEAFDSWSVNIVRAGELGRVLHVLVPRLPKYYSREELMETREQALFWRDVLIGGATIVIFSAAAATVVMCLLRRVRRKAPLGRRARWTVRCIGATGVVVILGVILILAIGARVARTERELTARRAQTFSLLGHLLGSGVPILESLGFATDVSPPGDKEVWVAARGDVREGRQVAGEVRKSGRFDPVDAELMDVGEETGELDRSCGAIGDRYWKRYTSLVERHHRRQNWLLCVNVLSTTILAAGLLLWQLRLPRGLKPIGELEKSCQADDDSAAGHSLGRAD